MAGNYGDGVWEAGTYGDSLAPTPGGDTQQWGSGRWGQAKWAQIVWPPGAVWKDAWRWWYQYAAGAVLLDLTDKVVEARWSTDSHTLGDGTFRGDLQPGRLELKLYDGDHALAGQSKLGQIWATFVPTGATWCWFVSEYATPLAATGDPALTDLVVTADTWPDRLTVSSYQSGRPAERVDARVQAIVDRLNTDTGLFLPAVAGSIEADAHTVPAVVATTEASTVFPAFLQQLRDAASNGLLWLEAVPGGAGQAGSLLVHYMLVETVLARSLYNDQVVAGSVWSQGLDGLITEVAWHGTDATGATFDYATFAGSWGAYGLHKSGPWRVWGDVTAAGAQRAACDAIANETLKQRGNPNLTYVDQLEMVSGDRRHPDGTPANAWDATRMVWPPHGVIQWYRVDGQPQESYRVVRSDHVLTARTWIVNHVLEPFVQPAHIP